MGSSSLTLSTLGKIFSRQHIEIFSYFSCNGDNLHKMSNPVFWEKYKKIPSINLSFADLAQRVVKVKEIRQSDLRCVVITMSHAATVPINSIGKLKLYYPS